ncbi:GAF domain-containing protein [Williamsia deligens]|uniref:GAF domain-containing protein n=1 Tax=Williamsia deligens TaxID=321325 RepID=A0ABW3GFG3_9NOCA|nr:GAF domain-containing protein [Williamsia deligens]MCP2196141.1 GAF domain-containing protein [Williamsia deligens]
MSTAPEPAILAGDDPRHHAEVLSAVYDARMSGTRAPARPRTVIDESWRRLLADGADPDRMARATPEPTVMDLDHARRASGLDDVVEEVTAGLDAVTTDGDNIVVVADRTGRVLWRSGAPTVLSRADRLGFVEGASWAEDSVGTNAIGTALVAGSAVQVFSAEHFTRTHHTWTCTGAPIRDARTGDVLGVVDVSGPAATIHPTTLALVDAVARLAESRLRELHRRSLDRLRTVAAPMLARMAGRAVAVDNHGWVAAVDGVDSGTRLSLPQDVGPGRVLLPGLGSCDLDPLPGGWLVRPAEVDATPAQVATRLVVDLCAEQAPSVRVVGPVGSWTQTVSPRHAEILYLLSLHHPEGRAATDLAADLFGDPSRLVTVRAEMSRLRRQLPGLIAGSPYRFIGGLDIEVSVPPDPTRLLPRSTAPAVRRARMA